MLNEQPFIHKDLNLLLLLVVLFEEQNTSRAAERLFVTQSAVSKGLKKLRDQLNNQLFVRTKEGFTPTKECTDLISTLRPLLISLESIYDDSIQTPPSYSGEISIAISSALFFPLADSIYTELKKSAPNATIRLINWSESTEQKLLNTDIQVGINYHPINVSNDLLYQSVLPAKFELIARRSHPLKDKSITFEEISKYPIIVSVIPNFTTKRSKIELTLRKLKLNSKIILRSDNTDLCLATLKKTNALMPVNHLLAKKVASEHTIIETNFDMNSYITTTEIGLFFSPQFKSSKLGKHVLNALINALSTLG
ncbi:LysR family transcriptional regulator [Vibrio harveyi]|nr:LysR family transcriptional regulator [Vibrio harveyi]